MAPVELSILEIGVESSVVGVELGADCDEASIERLALLPASITFFANLVFLVSCFVGVEVRLAVGVIDFFLLVAETGAELRLS